MWGVILLLVVVILAVVPMDAAWIERWYSTLWYPYLQRLLTPASNLVPFAWLDAICLAAAALLVRVWWRAVRRTGEPVRPRLWRAAQITVGVAAAAYLAFLLLWGLNYRRIGMAQRLVLGARQPTTQDVVRLGRDVVDRLNLAHPEAHALGWDAAPWRNQTLRTAFIDVQRQLAPAPPAIPGRFKQSLFGPFFRWTGVDGMVNPFGLEVLANPDLLPFEQPFVAAHEWAHLAGYADEAEANFVGWLTTIRADPAAAYSGWLYLYWQIVGELPAEERQHLTDRLAPGPRADIRAIVERLRRGDLPALRRASWIVYDRYLKANRVEEGVRSYGAVVTLILRAKFEDGWRPVRQASARGR